jgi:Outer membrane receptor proteins, mostly Fe transport
MRFPLRAVALALLFLACAVSAQDLDNVQFSGKITDSNGLAIAGASAIVTQPDTGVERSITTDDAGRFLIVQLKPGTYKIKAVASGFGAKEKSGIIALSGQNVQFDFQLEPADVRAEQTVTVSDDDASAVDTTRTVVGGTIGEREIEEIPNTERNPLDLVLTLGGTAEESLSTSGLAEDRGANPAGTPLEQGNFSLSGGTAYSNNITIDGLDNNDDRSSRDRFQPSIESIAEVQVITNQFSAEYGRASGGRVNLRTRSGGNRFRGRAFMFFRDARLNANTYYNNLTFYNADGMISRGPVARPPFTEYDPGFTLSGPVVLPWSYNGHNRTFFALAYEYAKFDDTTLIDAYLPVAQNPNFILPAPTGSSKFCDNTNTAPDSPACNGVIPTAGFVSPYSKSFATPSINHIVTARIDHKLFKNNDLTIGFQYGRKNNSRTNGSAVSRLEEAFQEKNSNTDAYNFTDNHVLGSRAVNQLRGQWSRYEPSYQTADPLVPVVLVSYRDPVSNSAKTLVAGNSTTSTSLNFADSRKETRWQFQDSLTYILGRHTLKGGFDVQNVNSKVLGLGDATGTFNFNSVLNYSSNVLSRFRQNFGTGSEVHNTYYGFFINDEMRPATNWTVSYGVRYERETAVSDNNNWGPRLGIAWDPFKKGKGVIGSEQAFFTIASYFAPSQIRSRTRAAILCSSIRTLSAPRPAIRDGPIFLPPSPKNFRIATHRLPISKR